MTRRTPPRTVPAERARRYYTPTTPTECWEWQGYISPQGYGRFSNPGEGVSQQAHRAVYTYLVGPIPSDLTLDHLCRNTRCVNPAHLEPVTNTVNILRGIGPTAQNARKTRCKYGHEFTPENTYQNQHGRRACRECARAIGRESYRRNPPRPRRPRPVLTDSLDPRHGCNGYTNYGCRCEVCTEANRARSAARRKAGVIPAGTQHGASCYRNYGCRCDTCRAGQREQWHVRMARKRASTLPIEESA